MSLDFIILYAWIITHVVVGVKLMPRYFKRSYNKDREEFHTIHTEEQSQKEAAMVSVVGFFIWPWVELWRFVSTTLINKMTAEVRKEKELEAAYKMVEEHKAQKERDEKLKERKLQAEFDRKLRGE